MYNVNTDLHLVPDCVKRFGEDLQGQSEQKELFHRLLESWDCVFLFLFFCLSLWTIVTASRARKTTETKTKEHATVYQIRLCQI